MHKVPSPDPFSVQGPILVYCWLHEAIELGLSGSNYKSYKLTTASIAVLSATHKMVAAET